MTQSQKECSLKPERFYQFRKEVGGVLRILVDGKWVLFNPRPKERTRRNLGGVV